MTPEQWQRISDLFESTREIPREERVAWLADKAGGDLFLEQEVLKLLDADERADQKSFLNPPDWGGDDFVTVRHQREPASCDERIGAREFQHNFTPKPALLEQGGAALAAETSSLIRRRLRATALIYICIFGILPFWRVLAGRTTDLLVTVLSAVVVVALAAIVVILSRSRPLTTGVRRGLEFGMLGMIAGLVTTIYSRQLVKFAMTDDVSLMQMQMEHFVLYSAMLILTFGVASPKRWYQTGLVVTSLALLPFITLLILCWSFPVVRDAMESWTDPYGQLSFQGMILLILAGGTVYESQSVHQLRRQVAEVLRLNQYHLKRRIGMGGWERSISQSTAC